MSTDASKAPRIVFHGVGFVACRGVRRRARRVHGLSAGVSWQVTGIRHDPFVNANRIPNEVPKTSNEVGHYLYPEAYGLPKEQGIAYIQNPQLLTIGRGPGA